MFFASSTHPHLLHQSSPIHWQFAQFRDATLREGTKRSQLIGTQMEIELQIAHLRSKKKLTYYKSETSPFGSKILHVQGTFRFIYSIWMFNWSFRTTSFNLATVHFRHPETSAANFRTSRRPRGSTWVMDGRWRRVKRESQERHQTNRKAEKAAGHALLEACCFLPLFWEAHVFPAAKILSQDGCDKT